MDKVYGTNMEVVKKQTAKGPPAKFTGKQPNLNLQIETLPEQINSILIILNQRQ